MMLPLAIALAACAHNNVTRGPSAAQEQSGDSGNSSESNESDNSSGESDQSSEHSNDSSGDSNNSSDDKATEQESDQSSEESSQDSTDDTSSKGEEQMTAAPVLTTAGVLITGAAVGMVIWLNADNAPPGQVQATAEVTRRWLAANAHQLAIDLALGAGPALDDLAGAAGIASDHRLAFGRLLRAHRAELLDLCNPAELSPARALAFLKRVGELSREDPVLAEDYRRFVRTHDAAS